MQAIASFLPPAYIFEGMRSILINHTFETGLLVQATLLNVMCLMMSVAAFYGFLRVAEVRGTLLQIGE